MKIYCVVYLVCGIHYRFRCSANNARDAKKQCIECMGCNRKDIVEAYIDEYEG